MVQPDQHTEPREGSLEAPTRHPLDWKNPDFFEETSLFKEMTRIFDICHGCRRCFSLCHAFPTLFDAVDETETMEVEQVPREVFWQVTDHCYLCDLCYMTKCPYVPPHPWNVDFPHLMLRAKAVKFQKGGYSLRDKVMSATDTVGRLAGIPVVMQAVNGANRNKAVRKVMDKAAGIHPGALLPEYHHDTLHRRMARREPPALEPVATEDTRGRVVMFGTCYANYNEPSLGEDLSAVFEHNGVPVRLVEKEQCCGMPKLELGDLAAVERAKAFNIPRLAEWVDQGWDIVAPVPSCVLMFKFELPLLFPDDEQVLKVSRATFDPFEYLMRRHKAGRLHTEFKRSLGKVAYHAPCHQRVQNIGLKTRDALQLIPDTQVEVIERCSGHDGTYAVKSEYHDVAMKIGRPVFNRVDKADADYYSSDCPMAGHQIENGLGGDNGPTPPLALLRRAYGI